MKIFEEVFCDVIGRTTWSRPSVTSKKSPLAQAGFVMEGNAKATQG